MILLPFAPVLAMGPETAKKLASLEIHPVLLHDLPLRTPCRPWLVLLAALAGCGDPSDDGSLGSEQGAAQASTASVCLGDVRQRISGFGASSAWTAPNISDELADQLFSLDGYGLSLIRLRIAPNGTTSETATALKAQARGALVWAAPWSPPGAWKTNGSDTDGGSLLPEHYPAWAARLALFVKEREAEGVRLHALSAQNEPDFTAEWETCRFTPAELVTFVKDHLRPALAAQGVSPALLAPESAGWQSIARYSGALLADPTAADAIGIVATHSYNGAAFFYPAPAEQGKELWMTEWSDDETELADDGMNSALVLARTMHEHLTVAEVNAWHYWWMVDRSDVPNRNSALVRGDVVTRRAAVMGQFSRFVRPNSQRLHVAAGNSPAGVQVSAFLGANGAEVVLVAINASAEPVTQPFALDGGVFGEIRAWTTTDEAALATQSSVPGGAQPSYELPARSVTTLVATFSEDGSNTLAACSRFVPEQAASDASGCSCREARAATGSHAALAAGLLLLGLAARRRRTRHEGLDHAARCGIQPFLGVRLACRHGTNRKLSSRCGPLP